MKRTLLLLTYLLIAPYIFAQVYVAGTIKDMNGNPLEGASVYINNTSIGTTSDMDGAFSLNLPKGRYDLIVSYVGYISVKYPLDTNTYSKRIVFKLAPKVNVLDEVIIQRREKMSVDDRKKFVRIFREVFLGTSKLASKCKILNEDTLEFDYDPKTQILEVSANEPLNIENRGLGYTMTYDLVTFEMTNKNITYLGYVKYTELEGSQRRQKRWKENRFKAYRGSHVHFLRSVRKNQVRKEGFMVNIIDRKPNPRVPSKEELAFADKVIKKKKYGRVGYLKNSDAEKDYLKALAILRRAELDPYIERLIRRNVREYQYTLEYDGGFYLRFPNFLKVTYLRELPEKAFPRKNGASRYQISMIKLHNEEAPMDETGLLKEPLDVLLLGYWAFEKVGDALPLDYEPVR